MSGVGPAVTVRFWAGARRAAGRAQEQVIAPDLRALRAVLTERPELAAVVAASSLLVDGVAPTTDDVPLRPGAVVDVLPPFAGG
ncbi:MoaD/ThiS family protein [Jatrophihabitans sp. YIM 134969]